jgi:hypothetical protein
MDNITKKTIEYYYNDPRLKEIIADLKVAIDELGYIFTNVNEIIKELARRLYEDNICEIDKISYVIKEILADKINEGKVSSRWIEKCLPKEYKRKYLVKSEQGSLSPKRSKTITITNPKKDILNASIEPILQPEDNSINPSKIIVYPEKKNEIDELQTYELEEALRKQQQFLSGDQIFSEESVFIIQQNNFRLVNEVIEKSNKSCYMKFDKNKILKEAWSDH